jgi:SAM-dependent methyltransferase
MHCAATKCRICSNANFIPILDLGQQYVANAFHHGDDAPTMTAPLTLMRCNDCNLVQLSHSVNRDLMYKSYWYKSGINNTMRVHLKGIVDDVLEHIELNTGDKVLDIGCNDCTLLSNYGENIFTVGIDPSNITPSGIDKHINDYFTAENVNDKFKIITSIAMFYDLDNPKKFVQDIKDCLLDDGIWVLELSYMPSMLDKVSYDTICHEHVTFYCLETFNKVLEDSGLEVFDVKFNDMNGGSFRLFVSKSGKRTISANVSNIKEKEMHNYDHDEPYNEFARLVKKSREDLLDFFERTRGKKIYGYGASTKGQIILQYCQLKQNDIIAIAERNPKKYGLYTPGTNIRICPEEEMRNDKPDFVLVFPWYFMDEFLKREKQLLSYGWRNLFKKRNCNFVQPLPKFKIL